ncbi:MAG: class I SAM-dependent methyltransferase [Acidimicrobiia bacterium]
MNEFPAAPPRPSAFRPLGDSAADTAVAESWRRVLPIAASLHPYDRNRLATAVGHLVSLSHHGGLLGPNTTWLEIGSGIGMKSLAIAPHVGAYLAVELDADQTARAEQLAQQCGMKNIHHSARNAIDVISDRAVSGNGVDVLMLYAVLEHLLPEERTPILELARRTVEQGGAVIVMETPNRLIPFDGHTTQLHHVQMLPDELAIEYTARSLRPEIRDPLLHAPTPQAKREVLYRSGRALSYHEFELAWSAAAADIPIGIDGFDVELLNQEPLTRQEVDLRRYVAGNDLPVSPAFCRSWIELVAAERFREGGVRPSMLVEPVTGDHHFHRSTTFWSLDVARIEGGEAMTFDRSGSTSGSAIVLLDVAASTGEVAVNVDGEPLVTIDVEDLRRSRLPVWHSFAAVELPMTGSSVELRALPGAALSGYGLLI